MTLNYQAPLSELHTLNTGVLGLDAEQADLLASVAEAMGRYAQDVLLPLNPVADRVGSRWQAGRVSTPPGFIEAYRQWCELGWPGLCADEAHGGQALSALAFSQTQEIVAASCHAFQMLVSVNHCASLCLRASARAELQAQWLPRLASGEVLSTMCMTEPQAGSDLGLARTRAVPVEAGRAGVMGVTGEGVYALHGTKVFISGGEHDLTDQVLHLVLARLPEAPAGSRGLSLFLVPRRLAAGGLNAVHCDGIEHKMGLHGNPTCTMRFDGAHGWLIGAPHRGLAAMFPMMNQARLLSGLQAVGLSEAALQASWAYAQERRQGRGPNGESPCRLVDHPDVQRMLLTQRAWTEGGRALSHWTAQWLDRASQGDAAAAPMLELLTPVIKGVLCENAQASIHLAIQIHGGHGYIHETGLEQLARDARILTLYEGTTGIQAADLLLRKVLGPGGAARCEGLVREVEASLQQLAGRIDAPLHEALATTLASWRQASARWPAGGADEAPGAAHAAVAYLRLTGHLLLALMWARLAGLAPTEATAQDKAAVAQFYVTQLLPEVAHLMAQLAAPPWHATLVLAPPPR